jgi:hypothetical protein
VRAAEPLTEPSPRPGDRRLLLRAVLILALLGAAGAVLQTAREVIAARAPAAATPPAAPPQPK